MSLQPSRLARWGRMVLGFLAMAVMFGPSLAAFATSRPVVPVPDRPRVPVIAVHPFLDVTSASCMPLPALHVGPTLESKGLFYVAPLRERMIAAASVCTDSSSGYLVLSVSVDRRGRITGVDADAGYDRQLAACATTYLERNGDVETRGPGSMKIGFFMGHNGL
jgi:hypothetical protein